MLETHYYALEDGRWRTESDELRSYYALYQPDGHLLLREEFGQAAQTGYTQLSILPPAAPEQVAQVARIFGQASTHRAKFPGVLLDISRFADREQLLSIFVNEENLWLLQQMRIRVVAFLLNAEVFSEVEEFAIEGWTQGEVHYRYFVVRAQAVSWLQQHCHPQGMGM